MSTKKSKNTVTTKVLLVLLALTLMVGATLGGTIAWLTDKTDSVKNTFTVGNIDITLTETKGGENREFKMVPGVDIEKDPKVTVLKDSEACWLFVKIEEGNDADDFLDYTIATGWTALEGETGVYYRKVDATTADTSFSVLAGDKVSVLDTVTKDMMDTVTESGDYPTLTFTAYAVQQAKFDTAAAAWEQATASETPALPD